MAKKDTDYITITVKKTTVAKLKKKKGSETWDRMLLRLAEESRCGIECLICGAFLELDDLNQSPNALAEVNGWRMVYSGQVELENGEMKTKVRLGYMCQNCWEKG